jgi:hypothetical protein
LFEPLGQTNYQVLLATNENLQKMIDQNKVEDCISFFRSNYVQRATNQADGSNSTSAAASGAAVTYRQETEITNPATKEYVGPYNEKIEGEQYFVFVIPVLDIDQPAFISGIEQFNLASYSNLNLKVEVQKVDDIRQIVKISGLPNKETASGYFTKVVNNRDLYVPLRNGTYRNFLINEANYSIFLKEKNITDYMNFYKRFYLGQ